MICSAIEAGGGELATALFYRFSRARLKILTKAKRSRFEKPVPVTFFKLLEQE